VRGILIVTRHSYRSLAEGKKFNILRDMRLRMLGGGGGLRVEGFSHIHTIFISRFS